MSLKITFLGAAGTVTGSKYLLDDGKKKILIDAGMFQGDRNWREKNWDEPPFALKDISAVLITHAHIDHIGMLPRLVKQGLNCPIYMTPASIALSNIMLPDSGRLQEEEAQYRSERGKSRHKSPQPLYTEADALQVSHFLKPVSFNAKYELMPGLEACWKHMGHIIGAGSIDVTMGGRRVTFSGDVGRYHVPILKDPEAACFGDLLLIESTYGDRSHPKEDNKIELAKVINEAYKRGGLVLIPSFAVGRVQSLLFALRELKEANQIPDIPVIIDSPMASDVTEIYRTYTSEYDEATQKLLKDNKAPFVVSKLGFTRSREDSIKLNSVSEPMILISASGMLTGGRILHHIKHRISDPRNTLLFVGFQPKGGRGDWIKSGAKSMRVIGDEVPIRAHIEEISGLSAHGDKDELLRWCRESDGKPNKVAIVHGEPGTAAVFNETLKKEFNWNSQVAKYQETWEI
jgi:metallo-beta-lactamase family protein